MNAGEFVKKWAASSVTERAGSQSHFNDLCRLIGHAEPLDADPNGDFFAFEKGASKTTGGEGFADAWLQHHFGWEYKGKHKDLAAAYRQVVGYHEALGHPPLLVVCDIERFDVHTKWTNTESWIYRFRNADLATDEPVQVMTASELPVKDAPKVTAIEVLRALFEEPERLRPGRTTEQITREAALLFGNITDVLRKWGVEDMRIARFVTRTLFCFFATDTGLLPKGTFSEIIAANATKADDFRAALAELFRTMNTGGRFGAHQVPYFNGRLFDDDDVPEYITAQEIGILAKLDAMNWADVEPAIFGTLFERVLDPKTRAKLGAHYTSRTDIETLVEPVLMGPLRREWEATKAEAVAYLETSGDRNVRDQTTRARLRAILWPFHERLASTRVLDPACGSGNFLYVALALMKGLEKELIAFAGLHGVEVQPRVHPRQLFGIEINPYAHELASIVIWIGYLQWKWRNAVPFEDEAPILQRLDQVELKDAILDLGDPEHPREPEWPEAEVIVGNPPFLGTKKMWSELTRGYVTTLRAHYDNRVPGFADLCCYWFERARAAIADGRAARAGLLATQAIRGGRNREVLKRIKESGDIFFAVSDRPWILDGAAVQISMVGFDDGSETRRTLDGQTVEGINPNLTSNMDITTAGVLGENRQIGFIGDVKVGGFDLDAREAELLLRAPNPHGRPNSDVLRPWINGLDITRRPRGMWIIDFPPGMTVEEAAKYERPFALVRERVKPLRDGSNRRPYRERWWLHAEPSTSMRNAIADLERFIVTATLTKHRLFAWANAPTLPDHQLVVFARDDDYFFGVLHSRAHELWALQQGTQLEDRPRYTPTTCFETFPLPWPPGKEPVGDPRVVAIAEAARELDEMRERWLNPAPVDGLELAESELKKRTLTNLYNERPAWLENAHRKLDEAVFAAYGWPVGLGDQDVLGRLLALNHERAGVQ